MSLPSLSRADRLLWSIVLVAAALVALVAWLLMPPEKTGGMERQPSTFFNVGYGTKAACLTLDRLEYPVTRLRRPIGQKTLRGIGVLFILRPAEGLQDHEMADLEAWVRRGHALVVAPGWSILLPVDKKDRTPMPSPKRPDDPEQREMRRRRGTFFEEWFDLDSVAGGGKDAAGSVSGTQLDRGDPLSAGIRHVTAGKKWRFAKSPLRGPLANMPMHVFWKDDLGSVGLRVSLGEGTIVALADPYPLTNFGIGEADNALLLDNIVRELSRRSPGRIAFDEYHLGFPERDWSSVAMVKLALAGPWRWAAAQAILVGVLALYCGAVRFGSPRDVVRKPRRQHREFAEAAGRLLEEGGAASLALQTLVRYYRERLCRALHLEPGVDDARLSGAVRDRSGQEIAPLLEQAQAAAGRRIGRQEMLTLVQELHRVAEALDHGF